MRYLFTVLFLTTFCFAFSQQALSTLARSASPNMMMMSNPSRYASYQTFSYWLSIYGDSLNIQNPYWLGSILPSQNVDILAAGNRFRLLQMGVFQMQQDTTSGGYIGNLLFNRLPTVGAITAQYENPATLKRHGFFSTQISTRMSALGNLVFQDSLVQAGALSSGKKYYLQLDSAGVTKIVPPDSISLVGVGRVLYVSKDGGNNNTAEIGNIFKPYAHPWAAAAAAQNGDLIVVMPGTYTYGTSNADYDGNINLWTRDNIGYDFSAGARIAFDTTGGFTGGDSYNDVLFNFLDLQSNPTLSVRGFGSFILGTASLFNTLADDVNNPFIPVCINFQADTILTQQVQLQTNIKTFSFSVNHAQQATTLTPFLNLFNDLAFTGKNANIDISIGSFNATGSYTGVFDGFSQIESCDSCIINVDIGDMRVSGKTRGIVHVQTPSAQGLRNGRLKFNINQLLVTDPYIPTNYANYANVTSIGASSTSNTQVGALFSFIPSANTQNQINDVSIGNYNGHACLVENTNRSPLINSAIYNFNIGRAEMLNNAPFYHEPLSVDSLNKGNIFVHANVSGDGDFSLIITGMNAVPPKAATTCQFSGTYKKTGNGSVVRQNANSNINHSFQNAELIVGDTNVPAVIATSTNGIGKIAYYNTRTNSKAVDLDATPSIETGTAIIRDTSITALPQKTTLSGTEKIMLLNEGEGRYITVSQIPEQAGSAAVEVQLPQRDSVSNSAQKICPLELLYVKGGITLSGDTIYIPFSAFLPDTPETGFLVNVTAAAWTRNADQKTGQKVIVYISEPTGPPYQSYVLVPTATNLPTGSITRNDVPMSSGSFITYRPDGYSGATKIWIEIQGQPVNDQTYFEKVELNITKIK